MEQDDLIGYGIEDYENKNYIIGGEWSLALMLLRADCSCWNIDPAGHGSWRYEFLFWIINLQSIFNEILICVRCCKLCWIKFHIRQYYNSIIKAVLNYIYFFQYKATTYNKPHLLPCLQWLHNACKISIYLL